MAESPETLELLQAIEHLLERMHRLTTLAERLANRAVLSESERRDVDRELQSGGVLLAQLDAMVTLWRQGMRPM